MRSHEDRNGGPSPRSRPGTSAPIGYDANTGGLTVCPEASAWAKKTRLEQVCIIVTADEPADRTVVCALTIFVQLECREGRLPDC
ncbi:hypothetical protein SUDANB1_08175 [Streptomyces sp. enrichment culture]